MKKRILIKAAFSYLGGGGVPSCRVIALQKPLEGSRNCTLLEKDVMSKNVVTFRML